MTTGFIKVVFEDNTNLFRQYPEVRKQIEQFLEKSYCFPTNWRLIQEHIYHRYCRICGEYLYSPCIDRPVHQHNHIFYKKTFLPKLIERIKIHQKIGWVELQRSKNTKVLRFPDKHGRALKSRRIPALALWTIDEWNQKFPELKINRSHNYTCIIGIPDFLIQNPLFYPS